METFLNIILLTLLAIIAFATVRMRHLFAVAMLSGAYSLVSAALFVVLDAVDVAFTEAAVGAGISTVLVLGALALTTRRENPTPFQGSIAPLVLVIVTGAALIYGTLDMPHFGDPTAPIHGHVAPAYISGSATDIGIPNIVTSVLASYRGFDTLGETVVVFAAGVGVLLLIGRHDITRRRRKNGEDV